MRGSEALIHMLVELASTPPKPADAPVPHKLKNTTQRIVYKMLVENSGTHILDSGGSSGRMWQRNRKIDLAAQPEATIRVSDYGDIELKLSLFHFLTDRLRFSKDLDRRFQRWVKKQTDTCWFEDMQSWPAHLEERAEGSVKHPYGGPRDHDALVENTYNEENFLSQDFQYVAFEYNDEEVVIVQSHNGADIRGGYSKPRVFTGNGNSEWAVFDYGKISVVCDSDAREKLRAERERQPTLFPDERPWPDYHRWEFTGGYENNETEYNDGSPATLSGCRVYFAAGHTKHDPAVPVPLDTDRDVLVVLPDGRPLCPACRTLLTAYPYP